MTRIQHYLNYNLLLILPDVEHVMFGQDIVPKEEEIPKRVIYGE